MSSLFYDAGPSPFLGRKVMLATTAYDSPDASYTYSIARSREALREAGVPSAYLLLQGNCHVDDARNTVVSDFLASDCTELVFLDADVSWEPEHLVQLCRFDCDLVGGVYPYRRDTGMDAMPVRYMADCFEPDERGLLEVEGLPTGFLKIRRAVLERMAAEAKTFERSGKRIAIVFERDILNGGRRGGDIRFCMRWREMGGRVFAAANLRLGHCGKALLRDSLAASLRRQAGLSLKYVADRIRAGKETKDDIAEAFRAANNHWGADPSTLGVAIKVARKAKSPIIEAGSGLSTVLMAAANPSIRVWCLEHSAFYAAQVDFLAHQAGVSNIVVVTNPLKDGWYCLDADLPAFPERFALGFVDGPPRALGDRMKFFDVFGGRCDTFLIDDADDKTYAQRLETWASENDRDYHKDERAAMILPRAA